MASPPRKAARKRAGAKAPARKGQLTAYQKRLRDYQRRHPGWRADPQWKQKARGHKAREHITRHGRWRDRAMAFAEQQAARWPGVQVAMAEEHFTAINERRKRYGESDLAKLQAMVQRLEERRARQPLGEHGRPERFMTMADMEGLGDAYEVPYTVFGYH